MKKNMIRLIGKEVSILNTLCIALGTELEKDFISVLNGDALKIALHITGEELSFEDDIVNSACGFLKSSEKYIKDNK